jgi:hypothetical protein
MTAEHSEKTVATEAKENQHEHEVTIVINGRPKQVTAKKLTYAEVVLLAFPVPQTGENVKYTVTFSKGESHQREGILIAGDILHIKEGMIINVTLTDKS